MGLKNLRTCSDQRAWARSLVWLAFVIVGARRIVRTSPVGRAALSRAKRHDAPQSITGRVQNRSEEDGKRVIEPVPDVRDRASRTSRQRGRRGGHRRRRRVPRSRSPDPGTYVVSIDVDTLPEGLEPSRTARSAAVEVARERERHPGVLPRRGHAATCKSKWSLLPQTLANGLKLGDDHRASRRSGCR